MMEPLSCLVDVKAMLVVLTACSADSYLQQQQQLGFSEFDMQPMIDRVRPFQIVVKNIEFLGCRTELSWLAPVKNFISMAWP